MLLKRVGVAALIVVTLIFPSTPVSKNTLVNYSLNKPVVKLVNKPIGPVVNTPSYHK